MSHPILTISRSFGSGGGLIAKEIGRRLGIPVYDNELISQAAEESGLSRELFTRSDERRSLFSLSGFFASWRSVAAQGSHDAGAFLSDDALFKIQSDVIRRLAEKAVEDGPGLILIGRCANYILRDLPGGTLDVFIHAPEDFRIARICEREGLGEKEAAALIARKDRTRQTYYNYYTLGNWGEASEYDLCVDSSLLGIEGTAEAIISFARAAGRIA